MQQWDFDIVHKRGALNHVPDAISREFEDECEVASFSSVTDPWYSKRIQEIRERPEKFASWRVEDGLVYKYTQDRLLNPVTNREECWRLVVPVNHRERVLSDAHREASFGTFRGREDV